MKYFNIIGINRAISLIREGDNTNEHVTSRATNALINFYLRQANGFYPVPEQIQIISRKKPDYAIEKVIDITPYFKPHTFVEVKSLVNCNIGNILDQLYDTVLFSMDYYQGSFSCFMVAMKGTRIAFYTYHNFHGLLDEYGIPNYKGFIPLNYLIPVNLYSRINNNATGQTYQNYVNSHSSFVVDAGVLRANGAIETGGLNHPHILDLVNINHIDDIHSM